MINLQTCKESFKILDLKYPFSVQEERKAFHNLARKYNPDLCENPECREENQAKLAHIMQAHFFLKENSNACHKIIGEQFTLFWNNKIDPLSIPLDINQLPYEVQKELAGAAEEFGWHL